MHCRKMHSEMNFQGHTSYWGKCKFLNMFLSLDFLDFMIGLRKFRSRIIGICLIPIICFVFITPSTLFAEQTLPKYIGHVNDYAHVLSADQIATLETRLFAYEDSTSTQFAVVIESSLNGYAAFDRAQFLARGWRVGKKGMNSGLLLYIAIKDRKYYTIVANRIQDKLGASRIGQIENEFLIPNLRNKNYFNAILETTNAYQKALDGKFKGGATKKTKDSNRGWGTILVVLVILFLMARTGGSGGSGGGYGRNGRYSKGLGALPFFLGGMALGGFGGRGNSGGFGGGSESWGGFGGGGGFDGGGAGGSW